MESIQLAQMLADLSDLDAAESHAALALLNASKSQQPPTSAATDPTAAPKPESRHHKRVASANTIPRTSSPAMRIDLLGRKILTPPMTRTNSTQGSIPGTPRRDSDGEDDIDRASTLMSLYEIRARIKQQDNTSLMRAREKIQALAAKQEAQAVAEKKNAASRYNYPKRT